MKYLFLIAALTFLGCISDPKQEILDEEGEISNDQNLRPDSSYLEDDDPQGCEDHYSYHKLSFDNKEYVIVLPIACNQAPYIEMGYPSELEQKFDNEKWGYSSGVSVLTVAY